MKIIKEYKVLEVTEKAYRVVYKGLGYKPLNKDTDNNDAIDDIIPYGDITKAKIIKELTRNGIEHNPNDKKEVLYRLLVGE